jgi:hypothetical protein
MAERRCKGCYMHLLSDRLLGTVLAEVQRRSDFDPARLLRGVAAHLRNSSTDECAVCTYRREVKELEAEGLYITAMLGEHAAADAEHLYKTEEYRAGVLQQRTREEQ